MKNCCFLQWDRVTWAAYHLEHSCPRRKLSEETFSSSCHRLLIGIYIFCGNWSIENLRKKSLRGSGEGMPDHMGMNPLLDQGLFRCRFDEAINGFWGQALFPVIRAIRAGDIHKSRFHNTAMTPKIRQGR